MSVLVAGKCRPEPDALAELEGLGFDAVELQLLTDHLDAFERSLAAVRRSDLDVVSVHTPHVTSPEADSLRLADAFAVELDATLVVHSQYLQHVHVPELEECGFESSYAYENNPGSSGYHVENLILEPGHDLVLDTAHLYMAERQYLPALEALLRDYAGAIPAVHLSDSTRRRDGLRFGAGTADLEGTSTLLKRLYDGVVVLEVHPPSAQADARKRFSAY